MAKITERGITLHSDVFPDIEFWREQLGILLTQGVDETCIAYKEIELFIEALRRAAK